LGSIGLVFDVFEEYVVLLRLFGELLGDFSVVVVCIGYEIDYEVLCIIFVVISGYGIGCDVVVGLGVFGFMCMDYFMIMVIVCVVVCYVFWVFDG